MDNVCHTLTGSALGEAGLKRTTRFGNAVLMIASNLPDIDVFAFATDTPAVAIRRGWTHGILAQLLLPALLAGVFVLVDRWRPSSGSRVRFPALLMLCYVGVLLHVGMDWLNNYGVRLLKPFSDRWFYGDAVFIVDPWIWLVLAAGVAIARRRRAPSAARTACVLVAIYILGMVASARAARERVLAAWTAREGGTPAALMVGPVPVDPFRKSVIVDAGDRYVRGSFSWTHRDVRFDEEEVPANADHPAARIAASSDPDFRAVLIWARFPYYDIRRIPGGTEVTLRDMRFGEQGLFTVRTVVPDHMSGAPSLFQRQPPPSETRRKRERGEGENKNLF